MPLKDYCFDGKKTLRIREMPTDAGEYKVQKTDLVIRTEENLTRAAELQERLYAAKQEGLVFALQARDAAGKDSLIKKVFSKLNPAGLKITSFKVPNKTDLAHDYMWRINRAMPERGTIGVFNRSHYEDVLVVQVHQMQKDYILAPRCLTEDFFERRYRQLNNWEEYLWENGFRMVKIFLNVSKKEQAKRFLSRIEEPEKNWKFSASDYEERTYWDEYQQAFEDAVNATSTSYAPWYVVPADHKWYMRYVVSEIITETLRDMNPKYPEVTPERLEEFEKYRKEIEK